MYLLLFVLSIIVSANGIKNTPPPTLSVLSAPANILPALNYFVMLFDRLCFYNLH